MPERKGGSYVMKHGKPELAHRTKPAPAQPKTKPASTQGAAEKPVKSKESASVADVKKENRDATA